MKSGALFIEVQLNVQKQFEFEFFGYHTIGNRCQQSTFTDGGVEGLYPTPHIHEQMTAHIMATSTATLSTTR